MTRSSHPRASYIAYFPANGRRLLRARLIHFSVMQAGRAFNIPPAAKLLEARDMELF